MFFDPLFHASLVGWLWSRRRRTSPTTSERKHEGRDRHANRRENRYNGNALLAKEGANALS
ncbi:MAG: hypothetical protein AB2653_18580 [Candidatus Thiodiazotropha endolucinida]